MRGRRTTRVLVAAAALGWALASGLWTAAYAQTSTGTIRGYVRDAEGEPLLAVSVVATQPRTNFQRSSLTTATGFFNLPGLPPGSYTVAASRVGFADQEQPVEVRIGQVLTLELVMTTQAVALEGITVRAAPIVEVVTSELATNITPAQIEAVPMNDRNFLSLAALAPGVTFGCQGGNCPPGDGGGLSTGGGSADQANVFVDGVSFKNDILRGGVAGQDASKGNPFPQVAVQEFRIITSQYKAEYPKATGAVIVATTKSGTNEWEASAFGFRQNNDLIEQDFFALKNCREGREADADFVCAEQPKQDRWQLGGSLGGPIIRDRLFFFASYEGNVQDRAFTVTTPQIDPWPAEIQQQFRTAEGTFPSEFRSHLGFGKLTYTPNQNHRFELSANIRDEFDVRNFGNRDALENAEDFHNDVNTVVAKHQYSVGNLLNEAQASYQYYRWFPVQLNVDLIGRNYEGGGLKLGGRCCPADRKQRKFTLRNDISYTIPDWAGNHVLKAGVNVDFAEYDVSNPLQVNPQFIFNQASPLVPIRAEVGFGDPGVVVDNTEFGIYVQDDWAPTPRLELNLGVRWDVESNGLNNDYVTPPQVVSELGGRDDLLIFNPNDYFTDGDERPVFKGAIQPRLGFSYDLSGNRTTVLFGGFGVYYDRNAFALLEPEHLRLTWAVYQIRFSADGSVPGTVAWDPTIIDESGSAAHSRARLQELIASGTAGKPEVFLVDNNTEPPRSNQFSLGVRQVWRDYLFSVNYTGVRSYNNFTYHFANRNATTGRLFETPSYRNVIVSTDEGRTWYDAIYFRAEKPLTSASRWGGAINYTLSWADEHFAAGRNFAGLSYWTPADFVRTQAERDQRHTVTANAIVRLPVDFLLSGIVTLGSGRPFRVFYGGDACATGNMDCIGNEFPTVSVEEAIELANQGQAAFSSTANPLQGEPPTESFLGIGGWTFRNVDLRLEKSFDFGTHRVGLIAEGFNIFNYDNFHSYEGRIANLTPAGGVTNVNVDPETGESRVGTPTGVVNDTRLVGAPRRFQFGIRYSM